MVGKVKLVLASPGKNQCKKNIEGAVKYNTTYKVLAIYKAIQNRREN